MAKWGEGDPRWIVEERADAHNVNNWHWTERDASDWSKKKLSELLKNLSVTDNNVGSCTIQEITSCSGEATVSNRKKKVICFYDFQIKAKWKGNLNGSDITYTGQLEIPNLSEENDASEVDVNIFFEKEQRECRELKDLMRKTGTKLIQEKLQTYMDSLRSECASAIQVPNKDDVVNKSNAQNLPPSNNLKNQMRNAVSCASGSVVGTRIHTKKLVMTEVFMTEVSELFKTMTLKDRIAAWSRSHVANDAAAGDSFSLFDGNVSGEYTKVEKDSKIVMRWRFKSWPDAHYSIVNLTFAQTSGGAEIQLEQSGVPQDAIEATRLGWKNYYWSAIKMTFGYGSRIL